MKKNPISYSRVAAAICITTTIVGSLAVQASFAKTKKDKPAKATTSVAAPAQQQAFVAPTTEEANQLVQQLIADRMVDESKGFLVEKKQNLLFINGMQQPDKIANKYLQNVKQTDVRVRVFSFAERLQMHPNAGIMELIMPVMFSAGCVDYTPPKKPGC